MKFTVIRFIMALLWIFAAYKLGDWRHWKTYYPTMLFFGMGDLIYHVVFCNKLLWEFKSKIIAPSINELFVIFTIFFSTTLLFISNFPRKSSHRFRYIVLWVAIYMAIEIFTTKIGMQKNHNGWNIWWSLLHNSIQFPLLILHHKNPILAWVIALIFLGFIMKVFKVPLLT